MELGNIKDVEVQKHSSGRLTKLYIVALSAVALLTIAGQLLIQRAITNQLSDSYVVNMAGRQRYTSQEICKLCLLIQGNVPHNSYPDIGIKLDSLLDQWKERHIGLLEGNERLKLPATESKVVKEMFGVLDPYFYKVYENASVIATESKHTPRDAAKIEAALRGLVDNEKIFLEHMNEIVYQYDHEARAKVLFLKNVEWVLFVLTILILLAEGLFIFRPVSKKIKSVISELIDSEQKALALTHKIKIANNSLNKSLKDIKGINFALELATIMIRTDRFGVITYANDKFCEILKYDKEELIGQRLDILSSHYHTQQFFDVLWETISSGQVWNDEIRNKAKDGSYVWLDTTIIPVLNDEHVPNQYIAIYTDLSEKFRHSVNEHKIRTSSVLEGQERERRKIARELHDGLGQMLTALKFNIQGIKPASSPEEQEYVDGIKNLLQETILEVRRISFDLMPSVLSDFGLGAALLHLSERYSVNGSNNVSIEFVGVKDIGRFEKNIEINTYRIIQEALNNAIKYADATNIVLDLQFEAGRIRFSVEDNGKGFTPQDKRKTDGSGRGMTNIRERVSLLNGNLIFNSIIEEGTTITVEIPAIII
ncbi:PAS domain-containing protein [Cytophaga aurantiaca]|uniref:sensor histidine kinase n=1 Tax=Cytophaga aurantiaca TaxID=29530 RepID=UPI0003785447|nr:PAS domain-containing protein [Cytophaga aurantiaca]